MEGLQSREVVRELKYSPVRVKNSAALGLGQMDGLLQPQGYVTDAYRCPLDQVNPFVD